MEINILIIDDEDAVQGILSAFLKRYCSDKGIQGNITCMNDPVESLLELTTRGQQYALILLDVRIPKLSGDEIYSSIEQVNPDVVDHILFVTGYPEDLHERLPEKQLNILQKPFRYNSFCNTINELLELS